MKTFKNFREVNQTCKTGEYYCNTDQKCKPIPSGYKVDDKGILVQEDAPVNNVGGGNIAGVGVGPAGEPGINKKKKKTIVMGMLKRNIKEKFDNNNIVLKQVLDGLDKVDTLIDFSNTGTVGIPGVIITEDKKSRKTFKQRYKIND
jgi:hypothetical protein